MFIPTCSLPCAGPVICYMLAAVFNLQTKKNPAIQYIYIYRLLKVLSNSSYIYTFMHNSRLFLLGAK